MKEFIEKLIGRLEEEILNCQSAYAESIIGMCGTSASNYISEMHAFEKTKKIVNQLAEEYINCSTDTSSGWIPASEPPKCFMLSDGRLIPFLVCDKLMWHPYIAFYNGKEWFTASEKINPTAYMPLPPAYVPEE